MSNDDRLIAAAEGNMGALTVLGMIGQAAIPSTLDCLERHQLKGEMIFYAYSHYCNDDLFLFLDGLSGTNFGNDVRQHYDDHN